MKKEEGREERYESKIGSRERKDKYGAGRDSRSPANLGTVASYTVLTWCGLS